MNHIDIVNSCLPRESWSLILWYLWQTQSVYCGQLSALKKPMIKLTRGFLSSQFPAGIIATPAFNCALIIPQLYFTTKSCHDFRDWNCILSISQSQLVNEERPIVRCFIRLATDVFSWLWPTTTQLPPNVATDSRLDCRAAHCVIWVELIFSCCATWAQVAGSEE